MRTSSFSFAAAAMEMAGSASERRWLVAWAGVAPQQTQSSMGSSSTSRAPNTARAERSYSTALDKSELGLLEQKALHKYADATRSDACEGCDHLCNPAVDAPVEIGNTLRILGYHDVYGEPEKAQRLFRELPAQAQRLASVDFAPANRACPYGVDVVAQMERARQVFGV